MRVLERRERSSSSSSSSSSSTGRVLNSSGGRGAWAGRRPGREKKARPGSRSEEEALEAVLVQCLPVEGSALLGQMRALVGACEALGQHRARGGLLAAWQGLLGRLGGEALLPGPRVEVAAVVQAARLAAGLPGMTPAVAAALGRGRGAGAQASDPVQALLRPFLAAPPSLEG